MEALSRFPAENPSPVLRVSAEGEVQYSNRAGSTLLRDMEADVGEVVSPSWQERIADAYASSRPGEIELVQ